MVEKDYQIIAELYCDPAHESCFFYEGVVCNDSTDIKCEPEEAYDYSSSDDEPKKSK